MAKGFERGKEFEQLRLVLRARSEVTRDGLGEFLLVLQEQALQAREAVDALVAVRGGGGCRADLLALERRAQGPFSGGIEAG